MPPLLLAMGFVNPALLGGLGLAAVPVIIHWLSRRYFRRVPWAAMRFLLEADRQNRRRVRLERWLLLALRCLVMALLALLVARPFVRPGLVASLLGGPEPVARIIVLDDSASLSYHSGSAMEFERLRAAAGRLLSWLHQEAPRDPVTLYLTSGAGEPLVADAVLSETELADLRERVLRRRPVNTPAHPRRVFEQIAERLAPPAAAGLSPRVVAGAADIYVLSDFQRTDWLPDPSPKRARGTRDSPADAPSAALAGPSVFEPLRRLNAEQVDDAGGRRRPRVILVASDLPARENVALLDVRLERPQTVAGLPAVVRAQLANFGSRPTGDLVVQVAIDGSPLPAVPAEPVEAHGRREVSLEVTFPDPGYHELALTVGPVDSFRADDTRRRAVSVKAALPVLLVNGQPAADPAADEVFLLRNALAPSGPLSSGVRVDVIDPEDIQVADLSAYDAILLCNVGPADASAVASLRQYVRAGGGLAFFLGSAVGDPAEYNRAWYAEGRGLLPLPLERLVAPAGGPPGVGLVRTREHPVTAMFPGGADALSESVHFWRYYRCATPAAESTAEILARFADPEQTPALIEHRFGRGRVLLFTSSADLDWNDWARALDGSYVVTMLELVQHLARRNTHPGQFLAGQPLRLTLSGETYERRASFRPPAYPDQPAAAATALGATGSSPARAPQSPADGTVVVEGPVAAQLGTYTVELTTRTGAAESRPLCVNLDPAEADLAVATPAQLDAALSGIPHELLTAAEGFLQSGTQTRRELWPLVLALLVATLVAEQGLAWWFGTGTAAVGPVFNRSPPGERE